MKLYTGYYNPVILEECSQYPELSIKSSNAIVVKKSDCVFYIRINNINYPDFIYLYSKEKLIDSFKTLAIFEGFPPKIFISKTYGESGPLDYSLDTLYCSTRINESGINQTIKWNILSYVIELVHCSKPYFYEYFSGSSFSKMAKSMVGRLVPNDKIILKAITVKDDNGNIYVLDPFEYTIP